MSKTLKVLTICILISSLVISCNKTEKLPSEARDPSIKDNRSSSELSSSSIVDDSSRADDIPYIDIYQYESMYAPGDWTEIALQQAQIYDDMPLEAGIKHVEMEITNAPMTNDPGIESNHYIMEIWNRDLTKSFTLYVSPLEEMLVERRVEYDGEIVMQLQDSNFGGGQGTWLDNNRILLAVGKNFMIYDTENGLLNDLSDDDYLNPFCVNIQEQLALCWIIGDDDIPYVAVQNIGTAEKTPVYQYDWLYGYSEARGVIIDKSTAFFYVNDNRDEGNQDGSVYYLNIDNNATEKIFSVSSDQAVRQFYKDTILMNQDNGFAVFDLTLRHIIIEGKGNILGMYGDLYAVQNGKSITLYDIDRKAKYTYDATTYIDELSADNIYVNLPWVEEPVVNIGTYASDEVIRLVFDVHQ